MIVTFFVPSADHPVGGVIAIYEFANAMSRRGHDVHLVHLPWLTHRAQSLDDFTWHRFERGITLHRQDALDERALPASEFVFYLDGHVPGDRLGLPLLLVQGYGALRRAREDWIFREPCPKVCVGSWLVDVGLGLGVPDEQLVHIPLGLEHEKYRVVVPIDERPLQIAMLYSSYGKKGSRWGLQALGELKRRYPDLRAVVFGTMDPVHEIPDGIEYLRQPSQSTIVEAIYNQSRIFVSTSMVEGFGMPCVEAMACGCALVSTPNGGTLDYAFEGDTALLCPWMDAAAIVDRVESLLLDDASRISLARRGSAYIRRFDWDVSAGLLEGFLALYGTTPSRYRHATESPPGRP